MYVQLKPGVPSCWLTLRILSVHPALPAEIDNASLQRLQAVHLLAAKRLSEIAKTMYLLAIELTPAKAQELLENVEAYKARMLGLGNELPVHETGLPLTSSASSSAATCDRVAVAKNAADLDRIIHILSFYWRHKLRKMIEKFLDLLFLSSADKVCLLLLGTLLVHIVEIHL